MSELSPLIFENSVTTSSSSYVTLLVWVRTMNSVSDSVSVLLSLAQTFALLRVRCQFSQPSAIGISATDVIQDF